MSLIQPPDLDIRNAEQLAAEAIAYTSGGLTVERIDSQIAGLRTLRPIVQAGGLTPICPDLTNANPSSPHTVLLEAAAWLMEQMAYRINQLPVKDEVAFAALFQITPYAAKVASTTLTFTSSGTHDATIPRGTQVSNQDGTVIFVTDAELIIPAASTEDKVTAHRTVAGATLLGVDQLNTLHDAIAYLTAVTNGDPVDSGSNAETTDQALARMRSYQRRAARLVSAADVEDAILQEVLGGNGIVRAFPLVVANSFGVVRAGHTSIVVMTAAGNAIDDTLKAQVRTLLETAIGNQYFYLLDPIYVSFNVEASIRINPGTTQDAVRRAVESALRSFYAAKPGNFGRTILRSEVIATIESTLGVDRVVSDPNGPILAQPLADVAVAAYEMPQLEAVTLNVV
jgi:uncharacterized phage protein gp47/JayE